MTPERLTVTNYIIEIAKRIKPDLEVKVIDFEEMPNSFYARYYRISIKFKGPSLPGFEETSVNHIRHEYSPSETLLHLAVLVNNGVWHGGETCVGGYGEALDLTSDSALSQSLTDSMDKVITNRWKEFELTKGYVRKGDDDEEEEIEKVRKLELGT